jgi:FkbM family methyltransferase
MTLHRTLTTSKHRTVEITSDKPTIINHFDNSANYADVVLDMFNTDRFYDQMFNGWDDLVILDIGANIGLFSLYIQDRAKVIYALEPTPSHYEILQDLTKTYSNIKPLQIALNDVDGPVEFYISDENSTMNSTVNHYGKKISVNGLTLPSLLNHLALDKVDFIKCDIEGSEMKALNDDIISAVKDRVKVWSIEVHATDSYPSHEINLNQNRDKLAEMLNKQGYRTYKHRYDGLYAYKV